MPLLAALYDEKGDWDVYVVDGLQKGVLNPAKCTTDVLGRPLPDWAGSRIIRGIRPSESRRLAQELKGFSKERRWRYFEDQAEGQSLSYSGTQS